LEILAVSIARPILEEYEALFAEAGYRLGVVMPSCLSALRLCDSAQTSLTLLIKAAGTSITAVLFERGRVRLVRCVDLSGEHTESDLAESDSGNGRMDAERHKEDLILALLQQTLAYAEDQLGRAVAKVLLCGFGAETEAIGRLAEGELGVAYEGVRSRFGTASQENAGLLGLLERYAA
jgi:hypothetical protein